MNKLSEQELKELKELVMTIKTPKDFFINHMAIKLNDPWYLGGDCNIDHSRCSEECPYVDFAMGDVPLSCSVHKCQKDHSFDVFEPYKLHYANDQLGYPIHEDYDGDCHTVYMLENDPAIYGREKKKLADGLSEYLIDIIDDEIQHENMKESCMKICDRCNTKYDPNYYNCEACRSETFASNLQCPICYPCEGCAI
jgi:hypothetical protein